MRIRQIRFKNLNSLAGAWEIDLDHPAYAADGIFAVTGPTGAGKTTILDAVCLALYGRTPRLGKIAGSTDEIMTRRTGECFAEVVFETGQGVHLSRWSRRRAHKKAGGELQIPRQELSRLEGETWRICSTSAKGTAAGIKNAVGMDFEQFTRSALLAQGGFAAFLQASPDERAPLLERITGTEIYSRISMRVHELRAVENSRRDALQAGLEGLLLLAPEQEQRLRAELEAAKAREDALALSVARMEKALAGIREQVRLERELENIAARLKTLRAEEEIFAPDRARLEAAVRCLEHAADLAALAGLHAAQDKDGRALKSCLESLPGALDGAERARESLKAAETRRAAAKSALLAARPVLRSVRELDLRIAEKAEPLRAGDAGIAEQSALLAGLQGELHRKSAELDRLRAEQIRRAALPADGGAALEDADGARREAAAQPAQSDPAELRKRLSLQEKQERLLERAREAADLQAASARAVRELEEQSAALAAQAAQPALDVERAESRTTALEKEEGDLTIRLSLQKELASYEKARHGLRDGEACPLCGSPDHPYARGNIPGPDGTEKRLAEVRAALKTARAETAALKVRQAEIGRDLVRAAESGKEHARKREEAAKRLEAARAGLPPGMLPAPADPERNPQFFEQLEDLRREHARSLAFSSATLEKAEAAAALESAVAALDQRVRHLGEQAGTAEAELLKRRERRRLLFEERDGLLRERRALYGDNNPDAEERRLETATETADKDASSAERRAGAAQQAVVLLQGKIDDLRKASTEREDTLRSLSAAFLVRLRASGFADAASCAAAALPEKERRRLAAIADKFAEERAALTAAEQEKTALLAAERAKGLPPPEEAENLETDLQRLAAERVELQQVVGACRQRLRDDEEQRLRRQEQIRALEAQKRVCAGWDELHALIGSADGKKYRNFAQGLTFDVLMARADAHLRKMTDRYRLTREDFNVLEPSVRDEWQAGELRSTRNLSGGESFLVSLALALGLSGMVGSKTPDSLFLDEGFGTLDDEALDIALDTLAGLRREGRLIGVISHVEALKERIGAQILVIPLGGGKSRLEGPGCRKLDAFFNPQPASAAG
ncbi:MAG: AAA family ATPase [Desulfovibrio sp.]|jgi:exonuclease SbcC|nr:AAA family ATPase [Desulfovibrio sp.]